MITAEKHFSNIENNITKLPKKLNFKIGEVSNILGLPAHVLRYWEKEFPLLKPQKFSNNQRIYSRKNIQILFLIKALLYEEKFSIEGMRKHLPHYVQKMKSHSRELTPPNKNLEKATKKIQSLLDSISDLKQSLDR